MEPILTNIARVDLVLTRNDRLNYVHGIASVTKYVRHLQFLTGES